MASGVRAGDIVAVSYRVERTLGTGGMGVVVAARHVESGVLRAVKIMHREPTDGAGWAVRFRREALVGQRLASPHAVRVHDVGGFDEGRPWIVMEHLEGTDLGKLVRKRGPLPIEEAAGYVVAACDAIAEAHDIGVVHRDLKPANLFLAKQSDGSSCLKVLDFGISKVTFGEDRDALSVTQSGEVIGSPAYMAPEQIRAFGQVDPRSDVWALGVILYELLTGKWPFPGRASVEMIAMVLERKPDPPSKHRADVPSALEEILLRCLEKDLDKRLDSARALRKALDPFLIRDDGSEDRATPVAPLRVVESASLAPPSSGPQPVSVPPASTASQAVQRTLPIEPRAREGPTKRALILVATTAIALLATTMIAVLRHAPTSTSSEAGGSTSAVVTSAPEPVARATSAPEPTSTAERAPIVDGASPSKDAIAVDSATPVASEAPEIVGAPTIDGGSQEIVGAQTIDVGADGVRRPWSRPGGKPLVDGPRPGDGKHVDPLAATAALRSAALSARRCKKAGGPTGSARVDVSFAPSGAVSSVRVGAPFQGTPVGQCITAAFRDARMPAFQGSTFTASKTVSIK